MEELNLPDESIVLGQQAAEIAATALDELGRGMIRQKALDVARQIELYLEYHHYASMAEMENDSKLISIAVTTIGRAGYSAVHDTLGINHFHSNPRALHRDLHYLQYTFPQFWEIIERSLTGETDGYYDWPEADGTVNRKYMYCVPIYPEQTAPLGLVVATTISIEEFLQPSREIRKRILALAKKVDDFNQREQRHNVQLRAINRYSRKISSFLDAQDLLPFVAETLRSTFQLQSVRVFLVQGNDAVPNLAAQSGNLPCAKNSKDAEVLDDEVIASVVTTGKPFLSKEYAPHSASADQRPCERERMVVPIKIGKIILGALDLINDYSKPFADFDLYTIWPLADQVAIALENARLNQELREMAVVDERNRIGREIHDTLAQGFAGISMLSESARQALKDGDIDQVETSLERIRSTARENLTQARRSVQSLRPNVVVQEEMIPLIKAELNRLSQLMAIETNFEMSGEERVLPDGPKLAVLRICQEALNNIKKHAFASRVNISLRFEPDVMTMLIQDDGIGFNPKDTRSDSFGLLIMNERAHLAGGTVCVESVVGTGTAITVNIPL
jgi:signal transduction histidine kinase